MELPDLTAITLVQLFGLLAITTAFDVLAAIVFAIAQGKFSLGAVAIWLQSHVLVRVFPIFALAIIGHGIGTDGSIVPPIPPAFALAIAGLGAYLAETIASIRGSVTDASRPTNASPAS